LTLFNLLLLGFFILLGVYTVQNVCNVRLEPEAVVAIEPATMIADTKEDSGKRARSSMAQQLASRGLPFRSQASADMAPRAGTRSIRLEREAIAASLTDPEQLLQEVNISPYLQGDQLAGFRIQFNSV
jgi:hypothetical protein